MIFHELNWDPVYLEFQQIGSFFFILFTWIYSECDSFRFVSFSRMYSFCENLD